jgi:membrane-associated HD superfamily phosphohydrolase
VAAGRLPRARGRPRPGPRGRHCDGALLGTVALLVGLTGLSAFQARTHPTLVWAAFALPAFGGALATIGLILMAVVGDRPVAGIYGWGLLIIGVIATFAGSVLFAIATYRTAALPRSGAVIHGITAAISLVSFVVASGMDGPAQPIVVAGLAAFALGWVVLGLQAIRLHRPAVQLGAA